MSDKPLKPCPFCGRTLDPDDVGYPVTREFTVFRVTCECGGSTYGPTAADAIAAWNSRAARALHSQAGALTDGELSRLCAALGVKATDGHRFEDCLNEIDALRSAPRGVAGLVPEGWHLLEVRLSSDESEWLAFIKTDEKPSGWFPSVRGNGPTPEAAIKNAAEKVKA